jgi:hypothetical protein
MLNQYEIEKEFKSIVDESTEDQPLREYLESVENNGQNEFIYYYETSDLYDDYSSECDKWLDEQVEAFGLKPWELFNGWDYSINSKYNKWIVVTAMFEEFCRDLLEELDEMED